MLIQCFQRPHSPTNLNISGTEYNFLDNCKIGDVHIPVDCFVCDIQNREHAERLLSFDHFKVYEPKVIPVEDEWKDVPRIIAKPVAVEQEPEVRPKNKGGRPKKVKADAKPD